MKKIMCVCLALMLLCVAGCGEQAASLDMNTLYGDLTAAVEMPQMLELNEGLMLDYCGIQAADVKQARVLICADSLRTDEIWLLEATDANAADRLAALAEKRLGKKGEESITYSPEQYKVVQKAQLIREHDPR